MITAIHPLMYSDDPVATWTFLRDVPGWLYVEDVASGPGWLIFRSGPGEVGVPPTRAAGRASRPLAGRVTIS